jgi:hypothetical protein
VAADFLDDILIEMAGVAQELARNVVCVLQSGEDRLLIGSHWALAQLHALVGVVIMNALNPQVVSLGGVLGDVVLEDNDIGIRDVLRVHWGDDGSSIIVDGVDEQWRASRQSRQSCETEDAPHDKNVEGYGGWVMAWKMEYDSSSIQTRW